MIVKTITKEEFGQRGCTPLPESEENFGLQINPEKDNLGAELDEINFKKDNVIDPKILKECLDEGVNLNDEYIKNTRDIFRMNVQNRKYLRDALDDINSEDEYATNPSKHFDEVIQEQIKEASIKKKESIDKYGDTICKILKQMHQGVLIDGKVSVRTDGIYPYRCQSSMSSQTVISNLLENETEIKNLFKDGEKLKTINHIYTSLDKLNFKITKHYWENNIDAVKDEVIYLDKPFLMADSFAGTDDDDIRTFYLVGIKIKSDGEIQWLGMFIDKVRSVYNASQEGVGVNSEDAYEIKAEGIPMDVIKTDNNGTDDTYHRNNEDKYEISLSYGVRAYLNKRFDKLLKYSLNAFLDRLKLTNELCITSTNYLKEKGNKWLIMAELLTEQKQGLHR
jgi:hypothetical protein